MENQTAGNLVPRNIPKKYQKRVNDDKQFFEVKPGGKNNLKIGFLFHRYLMEGVAMENEEMMTICAEEAKRLHDEE